MTKPEFLSLLRKQLSGLPAADLEQSIDYYNEIIEDLIEDGADEAAAVESLGPVESIASQILMDRPLPETPAIPQPSRRSGRGGQILLLVIASPIWIPLALTAVALLFTAYILLWAAVLTLYAMDLSFAAGALASFFQYFAYLLSGHPVQGTFILGTGMISAGFAILLFLGSSRFMKWVISFSKRCCLRIKNRTTRKGEAQ